MAGPYTLYGMAGSLYTAKVRAYMRQNHIPFVEKKAGSHHFRDVISKKVGRWIIPVIETPEGDLVQDGTDILDYFENKGFSKKSIYPDTPILRAVAHLFELFGGEGLLRPAMHYRWNFDDANLGFLKNTFRDVLPNGLDAAEREAAFDFASGRMRKATIAFGVKPETYQTVEDAYADFLARFEAHLVDRPYLLGGVPTIGDFGMFGALYAHLARDPAPLHLMQTTAPRVHRWTERMNMGETFVDEEYKKADGKLFADIEVPETLKAMMKYVAEEYLPEITDHVAFANEWLAEHDDIDVGASGTEKPSSLGRGIGFTEFDWRGHKISTAVMPYRFYLLQRLQDSVAVADDAEQKSIRTLFSETGLQSLLDLHTTRRVERQNHLEVWGATHGG